MAADLRGAREQVRHARPGLLLITVALALSGCTWTIRASVNSAGVEANGGSGGPALSEDGRYVAFQSNATNLVPGDTNNLPDIFVRDNRTRAVERVNVDSSGTIQANGNSYPANISEDGRYVSFVSLASNLVPGDTNGRADAFVHDRVTGATERVSPNSMGAQFVATDLSADGRYLTFVSASPAGLYLVDRETDSVTELAGCVTGPGSISDDGRYVAYDGQGCSGSTHSLKVIDLQTSIAVVVVSDALLGTAPVISGDGRFVVYRLATPSPPNGLQLAVRVRDLQSGADEAAVSLPPGTDATVQAISADGRYVAYETSDGTSPDDTNGLPDIYVHDRVTGRAFLVVRSAGERTAPQGSDSNADMSSDGRYVAFSSFASNLVPNDTNGTVDVIVRAFPTPEVLSATPASVARGTTATVHVHGSYLLSSAQVRISGEGVTVGSVTWVSEQELTVSVTAAPDATTGPRGLIVSLAGTGPGPGSGAVGTCSGCFNVG
jgi:Tol biopolymer transport system component